MAPVQQAMSLWFETIDKPDYTRFRNQVDKMVDADTGLGAFRFAKTQAFLGFAALRNIQSHNHKDRSEHACRDGWAGMTCVCDFKGGELCFPDLDVKLRYIP